ncbi:hypothetical protein F4780DRAFT_100144 [Xylariomycetidae sp. FL0641]|nr:hypothetical protein F4780DRAFT_100144 [Xylariomycetidae sp. FL0641]
MDAAASPAKRRALGPIDANTRSPRRPKISTPTKQRNPKNELSTGSSPSHARRASGNGSLGKAKRPLEDQSAAQQAGALKKARVSPATDEADKENENLNGDKEENNGQAPAAPAERLNPAGVREDVVENEKRRVQTTPTPELRDAEEADESVFDTDAIDTSQETAVTEPDVAVAVPSVQVPAVSTPALTPMSPPKPVVTREEAREKAETLRLRLRLADYKVRTGQTNVPLERLRRVVSSSTTPFTATASASSSFRRHQARPTATSVSQRQPLPGRAVAVAIAAEGLQSIAARAASVASSQETARAPRTSGDETSREESEKGKKGTGRGHPATPRRPLPTAAAVREDDDRLTSSALRGGAAKGLLSLSRS